MEMSVVHTRMIVQDMTSGRHGMVTEKGGGLEGQGMARLQGPWAATPLLRSHRRQGSLADRCFGQIAWF